jgi:hypothetical protein
MPSAITGDGKLTPVNPLNALLAVTPSISRLFLYDFKFAPIAFTEPLKIPVVNAMTFSYPVFMAGGCSELSEQFTPRKSAFCAVRFAL